MPGKLKLHILYEHSGDQRPHGCSYIRLLRPLSHPLNQDAFELSYGTQYKSADVLIVERAWQPGMTLQTAEKLVRQARSDGAKIIHTIDDNLLDLKMEGPLLWNPQADNLTQYKMVIRYFAREADGMIVSTEPLKERMLRFNDKIVVVRNALDERLIGDRASRDSFTSPGGGRKVIGYMGTFTHDADIMMITQALREVLRKNQDSVALEFAGGFADSTVIRAFEGLPVRALDVGGNVEYPNFMRWMTSSIHWDLAIAPLEESAFTRCKSDIKFLDYSALAIAGIYSRVPPYQETIRHLETGYLADNRTEDWVEALDMLLADQELRRNILSKAQEYVLATRTLKQCAKNWAEAIASIAG